MISISLHIKLIVSTSDMKVCEVLQMGIRASKRRYFLPLDVTRKCIVGDLDEIQTTGEMKDPLFKKPILKYYSSSQIRRF